MEIYLFKVTTLKRVSFKARVEYIRMNPGKQSGCLMFIRGDIVRFQFYCFLLLVSDLRESKTLKWIIDLTIAYPKGRPLDLFCIVFGNREPCQTVIYFRRYRVEDVPHTEEALLHWMYDRWAEKDKLLAHFYETGRFPESPMGDGTRQNGEPRVLKLNTAQCCLIHALYCVSTCIQLGMIYNVISSIFNLLS